VVDIAQLKGHQFGLVECLPYPAGVGVGLDTIPHRRLNTKGWYENVT
jgi:hypothetical protein